MTEPFMRESQRERLRSKELWTMMEWVVWLCPLCESERVSERELGGLIPLKGSLWTFGLPMLYYAVILCYCNFNVRI